MIIGIILTALVLSLVVTTSVGDYDKQDKDTPKAINYDAKVQNGSTEESGE